MTLCATVEATLGGNLPVPGYFGSTSKCISGSEWRDPVDIYRGYAGRGREKREYSGSSEEKRRKRGEGFSRWRIEEGEGWVLPWTETENK